MKIPDNWTMLFKDDIRIEIKVYDDSYVDYKMRLIDTRNTTLKDYNNTLKSIKRCHREVGSLVVEAEIIHLEDK